MPNVGITGAGNIGEALARTFIQHGYTVTIANSRGPETLAGLVADLGPSATAATAAEAGAAGDFVVQVEVDPQPLYRRAGHDLYVDAHVSIFDAAVGGHVSVKTPDGDVPIEIPAGTHGTQRFRLRKRGVPRLDGGGRGDLWAFAQIVIPAVTDDRGRSLLRELAQALPES